MSDYTDAKALGLTSIDRWGDGLNHHPMSARLARFLADHDFEDYGDYFCWKVGGDGDNGETLMFQMDAFFEWLDTQPATARRLAEKLADHHGCPSNSRDYCDCATCDPDEDEAEHLATSAKCWIRVAEEDGL